MYEARLDRLRVSLFSDIKSGLTFFRNSGEALSAKDSTQLNLSFFRLFTRVFDEIQLNQAIRINISPYKEDLLSVILIFDLDKKRSEKALRYTSESVYANLPKNSTADVELFRKLKQYEEEFAKAFLEYTSIILSSEVVDILKGTQEYQYSSQEHKIKFLDFDVNSRKIYTLFTKNRYFEFWRNLPEEETYSPLDFNNRVTKLGFADFKLRFTYNDTVLYKNKLYKLKSTIKNPTRDSFVTEEWSEYSSKVLDKTKTFDVLYKSNILQFYDRVVEKSFEANAIISDSSFSTINPLRSITEGGLDNTWGGEGKKIYDSFLFLQGLSTLFGGYQGSPAGAIDYASIFLEYFFASTTGRNANYVFVFDSNQSIFGDFEKIYLSRTTTNKLAGLRFLDSLSASRAFNHNRKVSNSVEPENSSAFFNPIYSAYKNGLESSFDLLELDSTYDESGRVDLLLYSIRSLYSRIRIIGDLVEGIKNSLNDRGQLRGFEGLGDISWQIDLMANSFPPSRVVDGSFEYLGGMAGAIRHFIKSYEKFSSILVNPKLPNKALQILSTWVDTLYNGFETCYAALSKVFIDSRSFIPNISFKNVEPIEFDKFRSFLNNAGLRESEINEILRAESFSNLIETFAPISDSQDLRSFFKAYELCQLLYEFGGQSGVDAYLKFLFSGNEIENLLNVLSITNKNPSEITKYQSSKYPKLIGLLIGLTYAINPIELDKFKIILGNNSLNLLESINYLLSTGQTTLIKNTKDIDLLTPLVSYLLQPAYKDADLTLSADYGQVKKYNPIQLKEWITTLEGNLGNVTDPKKIVGLFDKVQGMTPKELLYVLNFNSKNSLNPLGEILDGFSGGRFTSFIKYANLAGLTLKFSIFTNSYQPNNFEVKTSKYSLMFSLLEELEKAIDIFKISKNVFKDFFEYSAQRPTRQEEVYNILFNSQNKSIQTIANIASSLIPTEDSNTLLSSELSAFVETSGDPTSIIGAPGKGNSPIPNRTQVINSVTPEQALFLSSPEARQLLNKTNVSKERIRLIEKFIKIRSNPLLDSEKVKDESEKIFSPVMTLKGKNRYNSAGQVAKQYVSSKEKSRLDLVYEVQPLDFYKSGNPEILTGDGLGINYVNPDFSYLNTVLERVDGKLFEDFDPIESCVKFGGNRTECEERFINSGGRCGSPISKALTPESYEVIPQQNPSKIYVDRPLGTFGQYKPRKFILPTEQKGPTYYSYLNKIGFTPYQSERGEPLLTGRPTYPEAIIPDPDSTILSEYVNSEFGLKEYISIGYEKDKELSCMSLQDPYAFQACMNMLKCKRFSPPYEGEYFLSYCPRGSAGGRLR